MKTFDLTGVIGIEILPQNISEILKEADGEDITVNFVSVGGYLFEAFQIYNQFKEYSGQKTLIMNGIVASAGAYISTAFDEVKAKDNSTFMIHNAMGGAIGDYRVLEKESKELRRLNDVISRAYAARSGESTDKIIDMMNDETWFYGNEIVEAGFADELVETGAKSDKENILKLEKAKFNSLKLSANNEDITKAAAFITEKSSVVDGGNINTGRNFMATKTEVLKTLNVLKQNAEITLPEIAEALGLTNQIVTQAHTDAMNVVKTLADMKIDNPVNEIKNLRDQIKKDSDAVRDAKLDTLFGAQNEANDNELRFYMGNQTQNVFGDKLEEKINEMKESDPIVKRLMAERADQDSEYNQIGISDEQKKNKKENNAETSSGSRVDVL